MQCDFTATLQWTILQMEKLMNLQQLRGFGIATFINYSNLMRRLIEHSDKVPT